MDGGAAINFPGLARLEGFEPPTLRSEVVSDSSQPIPACNKVGNLRALTSMLVHAVFYQCGNIGGNDFRSGSKIRLRPLRLRHNGNHLNATTDLAVALYGKFDNLHRSFTEHFFIHHYVRFVQWSYGGILKDCQRPACQKISRITPNAFEAGIYQRAQFTRLNVDGFPSARQKSYPKTFTIAQVLRKFLASPTGFEPVLSA